MNHHYGNKVLFLFACIYKYLSFLHIFALIVIHVMYIYISRPNDSILKST